MAAEQFSLELLGPIILETRDRVARIEAGIGAITDRLEHHQSELDVVSGLAMRATGERVAWASVRVSSRSSRRGSKRWSATAADIEGQGSHVIPASSRVRSSAGGGVHCYAPDGDLLGRILVPEVVSNVCFGGLTKNRLYICGTTSLYAVLTHVNGAQTPQPCRPATASASARSRIPVVQNGSL